VRIMCAEAYGERRDKPAAASNWNLLHGAGAAARESYSGKRSVKEKQGTPGWSFMIPVIPVIPGGRR
jgi:hypothetical protein